MPVNITNDKKYVYALSHGSNTLRVFDSSTYIEVASAEVGSNPFAFLKSGTEGYVASYDSDEVCVMDMKNMKIKETIKVGKGPFQLIEREGRIMSKYRVLVVDDESDMRQLVGMYLDNFGYEWGEAENGKEALTKLESNHYDFVVLDIMMPEMDGLSVCKEIRKTSDVPIIFLTAKGEEWNRVNGLRMGADDYIVKPFSPGELIARMEAVLRRYTKQERRGN